MKLGGASASPLGVIYISKNSFILDSFTWSYSRINSYYQCPRSFKLQYIDCLDQSNNAFALWGSLNHSIFERYYKGELQLYELSKVYEQEYRDYVTVPFPPNAYVNLNHTYYDGGKEYWDNFEGLYDNCKILGIEQEVNTKIDKYDFTGYIDLILEDENGIFIVDHKSKKFRIKKECEEYFKQLYIYSLYIYEKYGVFPYQLVLNTFRMDTVQIEPFNKEKYEASKQWVVDTIAEIYKDKEFNAKPDNFFCNFLCSVNMHCPYSDKYIGG